MAKHKFIAKINVKGDFDAEDGLGVAQQEIAAGQTASMEDKKLYDQMVEQGYIKPAKAGKGAAEDDEEVATSDASKAPAVKTSDKTGGKK